MSKSVKVDKKKETVYHVYNYGGEPLIYNTRKEAEQGYKKLKNEYGITSMYKKVTEITVNIETTHIK